MPATPSPARLRPASGAVATELGLHETVLQRWMMQFGTQARGTPRRSTVGSVFDAEGQVLQERRGDGSTVPVIYAARSWTANGKLLTVAGANPATTTYLYGGAGAQIQIPARSHYSFGLKCAGHPRPDFPHRQVLGLIAKAWGTTCLNC